MSTENTDYSEPQVEVHVVTVYGSGLDRYVLFSLIDDARAGYEKVRTQLTERTPLPVNVRLLTGNIPVMESKDIAAYLDEHVAPSRFKGWALVEELNPELAPGDHQWPEDGEPAGWTYKAQNYCTPHAVMALGEQLNNPLYTPETFSALDMSPWSAMCMGAEMQGVDLGDLHSFNSDDFPKPFTKEQAEPDDECAACHWRFSDCVELKHFSVLGVNINGAPLPTHVIAGEVPEGAIGAARDDGVMRWMVLVTAKDIDEAVSRAVADTFEKFFTPVPAE